MKLAHISEDYREQSIKNHLEGTAEYAKEFGASFGCENEAEKIGLMHDIGKYSEAFQKRLHGGPKVDHSTAGAYEFAKNNNLIGAMCVAGHHGGLPDLGTRTNIEGSTLNARLNRASAGELEDYSEWKQEIEFENSLNNDYMDPIQMMFKTRMLFSCLVDADYLDTERFMRGDIKRGVEVDFKELDEKIGKYTAGWYPPKNDLNKVRHSIYEAVLKKAEADRGIFTLTVPTGGGKTVTSLAFSVKHALKNGLNRIIYIIPYTSIIEQNAEVFRKILGDKYVLEHHSGVLYENEESLISLRNTENWDVPVVITTSVQFFESIYGNRASSSRKLHNVSRSVIIFDEAQMLPIAYLKPCIRAITELVKNYNVSAVLCTATQPSLNDMFNEYLPEYTITELCPSELFYNQLFNRVSFIREGVIKENILTGLLEDEKQVLCIVNSRRIAKELYKQVDGDNCYHLSTEMYPMHRKRVLTNIKRALVNGEKCIVISTSLIEAGVDIDFPTVYRQVAGLDSIIQAAGRCNREGKRNKKESKVHIFELEQGSPELFSTQIEASSRILDEYDNISGKEAINDYYEKLYYLKGDEELDKKHIEDNMKKFAFSSISKDFKMIDNDTRKLYIETLDNEEALRAIKKGFAGREEYRLLNLYSVNIYEYQFRQLVNNNAVELLEDGSCILSDSTLYKEDVGLSLDFAESEALFI